MKKLIINADDFGNNPETNRAISELFEERQITSSTLLTVAPYADEAAKLARDRKLAVGVHFTINSDPSENRWRSLTGAKSLDDGDGLFSDMKKITLNAKSREVSYELEQQFIYMANNGCMPDHADSHCGTLYGVNGRLFFINAFRFCSRYDLPFRLPKNPRFINTQLGGKAPKALLSVFRGIVKLGERRGVKMIDDIIINPDSVKKLKSYETLRDYYLGELRGAGEGVTEIVFHPSYPIGFDERDSFESINDFSLEDEWTKRVWDCKFLKSGDLLTLAEDLKIEVVSYKEAFDS